MISTGIFPAESGHQSYLLRLDEGGGIVLPQKATSKYGLKPGDTLTLISDGYSIRFILPRCARLTVAVHRFLSHVRHGLWLSLWRRRHDGQ